MVTVLILFTILAAQCFWTYRSAVKKFKQNDDEFHAELKKVNAEFSAGIDKIFNK